MQREGERATDGRRGVIAGIGRWDEGKMRNA